MPACFTRRRGQVSGRIDPRPRTVGSALTAAAFAARGILTGPKTRTVPFPHAAAVKKQHGAPSRLLHTAAVVRRRPLYAAPVRPSVACLAGPPLTGADLRRTLRAGSARPVPLPAPLNLPPARRAGAPASQAQIMLECHRGRPSLIALLHMQSCPMTGTILYCFDVRTLDSGPVRVHYFCPGERCCLGANSVRRSAHGAPFTLCTPGDIANGAPLDVRRVICGVPFFTEQLSFDVECR